MKGRLGILFASVIVLAFCCVALVGSVLALNQAQALNREADRKLAEIKGIEGTRSAPASLALSAATPYTKFWQSDGRIIETMGTETRPIGMEFMDNDMAHLGLSNRISDIEFLLNYAFTDPKLRGHILRHDVPLARLNQLAAMFPGDKAHPKK